MLFALARSRLPPPTAVSPRMASPGHISPIPPQAATSASAGRDVTLRLRVMLPTHSLPPPDSPISQVHGRPRRSNFKRAVPASQTPLTLLATYELVLSCIHDTVRSNRSLEKVVSTIRFHPLRQVCRARPSLPSCFVSCNLAIAYIKALWPTELRLFLTLLVDGRIRWFYYV